MKVGFIGLGAMGSRMAINLLKAGYELTVYDKVPEKIQKIISFGAKGASSPKEVAEHSYVVLLSLPGPNDVEDVVLGKNGVLDGLREGGIIADLSTIDPYTARKLYEECKKRKVRFLDAPVSGGVIRAESGTLTIMVGGEQDAYTEILSILKVIGKDVLHVGPSGMGQVFKLANNALAGINVVATAEILAWAMKEGADLYKLYEVIKSSSGNSWIFEHRMLGMIEGKFEPGFMIRLYRKDLELFLKRASETNTPTALTSTAFQIFNIAVSMGLGDKDANAIIKVIETLTGLKISKKEEGN
jgi:3-hydroxyisobutyrate dehydrogenase